MKRFKLRSSIINPFFFKGLLVVFLFQIVSCSKETPSPSYTKVSIDNVTILNFPNNNAGVTWDNALEGYDPDVYFKITNAGLSTVLYDAGSGSMIQNLTISALPYYWYNTNGSAIYTHNNLSQAIDIDLYDYDIASADKYMGSTTFNFSSYTTGSNKYPSSATVTNGSMSIQLELSWLP